MTARQPIRCIAILALLAATLAGCVNLPKLQRGTSENVQRLDRALAQDPSNVHANFLRGRAALQNEKPGEAVDFFELAVQAKPEFEEAWIGIGTAQMDMKKYAAAEETFRNAASKFPASAAPLEGGAAALLAQNRVEEAAKLASAALALDPNSAQAHRLLGEAAYTRSEYADALAHWRAAMKLDSTMAAELRPMVEDLDGFEAKYGK